MRDVRLRNSDHERVATEMEKIRSAGGGTIDAKVVVESAQDPSSPLHQYFTWDDTEAAAAYRIEQARCLIRAVVKVLPQTGDSIRAYVSLPEGRRDGSCYRSIVDVMDDDDLSAMLLGSALAEIARLEEKYKTLVRLKPVFAAAHKIMSAVSGR